MNLAALTGELIAAPHLRTTTGGDREWRLELAVPRRTRSGRRDPGVVRVMLLAGPAEVDPLEPTELVAGAWLEVVGRLEDDPAGMVVLIDHLSLL